jgi:EAL domain-containing protein (putative c-di-GMP-specific phosphodiesterase class I)
MEAAASLSLLDAILATDALEPVFQPIVELPGGRVVGYEALARGPRGSALQSPADLFSAARAEGRLDDLDEACQAAALRVALDAGLRAPLTLFVNVEPQAAGGVSARLRTLYATACAQMRVVVEVTERALTTQPAELLSRVAELRSLGCAIALDDVGADERSLAMMAFLEPDVIKLDLALVQRHPDAEVASVVTAVNAEAERTGAAVLVEGIETAALADAGVAMGASLGQGWHFGRPGPLGATALRTATVRPAHRARGMTVATPFALVEHVGRSRTSTKPLLYAISKHLENQARVVGSTAVVLAAFQHADYMTPATRRRYGHLARSAAYCAALGVDLPAAPAPGVHGTALRPDDPIVREWDVAVVSPHFAAALVARDEGDTGPDAERRFRYVVTYDRTLAIAAARAMMTRIAA